MFLILNNISEKKMAAIDNLTAILYKVDDIRLEQVPVPEPSADQVKYQLIRYFISYTGNVLAIQPYR